MQVNGPIRQKGSVETTEEWKAEAQKKWIGKRNYVGEWAS